MSSPDVLTTEAYRLWPSQPRPNPVAAHDAREHVGRGAESDGVHEAVVDGEVEDDFGRTEVEPSGTGLVTDEVRSAALARQLPPPRPASRPDVMLRRGAPNS